MNIRHFQSGDEAIQAEIYNAAAGALPHFKPATSVEVHRRTRTRDFDPTTRFYAQVDGKVVGYAMFQPNGRVSYPWCLSGHESCAEPLFERVIQAMRERGVHRAFAAYRPDWVRVHDFFRAHGFHQAREVMNFVIDLVDMPTPSARVTTLSPVTHEDMPAICAMCPEALRLHSPAELEKHLLRNPLFSEQSVFALRSRSDNTPVGVGVLIVEPTFANPRAVDPNMPCYRLGAFGSENMATKRINGLFSFLARRDANVYSIGMDLMAQAALRLRDDQDLDCLAGQVGSDAPSLLAFYERNFRFQGKFPVFEREIG